ncbi:MAG: Coenzyme F420 hydrogenase/dehydrogenase, beta subunit C-terminal domain [Prevotella sp.]|nr:Coenzyme F420 hydrogenase/dehydrogenase, beta subunit C-terminal domain [Prevotella sp.]
MPKLVNWEQCCGCGACANKCLKQAISMLPNHEGFLHPVVDAEKCVECGACEKACPGLHPAYNENALKEAFVLQHKNDAVRYQSTSGGAFTAIAEEVIRRGGVVFGAVMTEDLRVVHGCVETMEDLARFRNSKYVQSEIGDCYSHVKHLLNEGRWVCFSGTPCQINGLIKFLGRDYERLVTVDVVCKSVPSPLIFKKYVEYKKGQEGGISDVVFRDKKRGFLYCTMAHYLTHDDRQKGKDVYRRGSESDEWLRMFLSGKISRRSCMICHYQTIQRVSDFTLGDIWETGYTKLDDNRGSTLVHVWTQKGEEFLNSVRDNVRIVTYPVERSRGMERKNTLTVQQNREKLFEDANNMEAKAFFAKYAPYSMKVRIKNAGRYWLWRLGLQNIVRHVKHLIIHR